MEPLKPLLSDQQIEILMSQSLPKKYQINQIANKNCKGCYKKEHHIMFFYLKLLIRVTTQWLPQRHIEALLLENQNSTKQLKITIIEMFFFFDS